MVFDILAYGLVAGLMLIIRLRGTVKIHPGWMILTLFLLPIVMDWLVPSLSE